MSDTQDADLGQAPAVRAELANAWPLLRTMDPTVPATADVAAFLRAAFDAADLLRRSGLGGNAADVMTHLEYLATKAGADAGTLRAGALPEVHPQVLADAVHNVSAVIARASEARARAGSGAAAPVPADILQLIEAAEGSLQGWCSRQKSVAIASAVLDLRPEVCVEIGVYGGRSAVPCAAALRHLGKGVLYGVESWSAATAVEHRTNPGNDAWWAGIDFGGIKAGFYRFLVEHDLTRQVRIVEAPSARAALLFDRIDFLHIDGAHSIVNAAEDVVLYAQKVRQGGIVVFDDVNWTTTAPAMSILEALCDTVQVLTDPDTGKPACAVLRRH